MARKRVKGSKTDWKRHAGNAAKVIGGGILGAAIAGTAGAAAGIGVGASLASRKKGDNLLKRGVRALTSGSPSHQMLSGEARKERNQYKKEGWTKEGKKGEGRWVTIRGGKRIFIQDKKGGAPTKAKAK